MSDLVVRLRKAATLLVEASDEIAALEKQLDHLLHPSQGETVTLQSRLDDMTAVATSLKAQLAEANGRIEEALAKHVQIHDGSCSDPEHCYPSPNDGWECSCGNYLPCPTVQALTSETEASDDH